MFYLHVSNRTENLLQQLAAVLQTDKQSPFKQELFLVQSQGMERVICQGLAESLGVFCNYRFLFPLEFLHFVAERLGEQCSPDGFDRGNLLWRLEALLRDIDSSEYQPISSYLQGEDRAVRRFQLASRLADCFDKYQLMRSEMVLGWDKGEPSTPNPSTAEKWQMALWQRLLAQKEASTPKGNVHQAKLFADITQKLERGEEGSLSAQLPHRISVFGVHTLPPVFFSYLAGFARHGNVHFYLLSPCREYWGDIKDGKRMVKEILKNRLPQEEDGFSGFAEFPEFIGRHPLLASLGQQGRDLQEILVDMDISMEFSSYIDPVEIAEEEGRPPRLLEVVQRDLLNGEVGELPQDRALMADDSIAIVSCHSRVRELEVLREHILRFLDEDEELQLRQIVVMAPDIQQYAPFIGAIFHDIEHSVADRSLNMRNSAIAAFSAFLSLFSGGKFGRSAVLELLQFEGVAKQFSLNSTDLEKIVQWTEGAGIRWGLSASDQHAAGDDAFDCGSFCAGLSRLLMGYAANCDDFICDILPFPDIEGKEAQALGGLCHYIELLEQTAQEFQQPRPLSGWRDVLLRCVDRLLATEETPAEMELRGLLGSLGESECFSGEHDVEFAVIVQWFAAKVSSSNSSSGFLRGQLTFCSMLPMRSIPFQVVCLLGIDDGVFPKSDRIDTFNLMSGFAAFGQGSVSPVSKPRPGDRSPTHDDRYQFLEAILSARRSLYLSYVGQSEKTGESGPPSVVISELLDLLHRGYGVDIQAVEHPLYPFGSGYFDGSSAELFSYSEENRKIAEIWQESGKKKEVSESIFPWWQGEAQQEKEAVAVSDITKFYKDPPGWFVSNIMGISLEIDESAKEDVELFTIGHLGKYKVETALFEQLFDKQRAVNKEERERLFQHSLRSFQQKGEWVLGAPGKILFNNHFTVVEQLVIQAKELDLGEKISDLPLDIPPCKETAQLRITGTIPGRYERGNLVVYCGKLKGHHLLAAWIYHLLDNFQQAELRPTWLLTESGCNCFFAHPTDDEPGLLPLLQLWKKGSRVPLPLYTEAAFTWAEKRGKKDEADALQDAIKKAENDLKYKPEWTLLLGKKEIEQSMESTEFIRYAKEIMAPLYSLLHKKGGR